MVQVLGKKHGRILSSIKKPVFPGEMADSRAGEKVPAEPTGSCAARKSVSTQKMEDQEPS